MSLVDITRPAVLRAVEECDRIGNSALPQKHGGTSSPSCSLVYNGRTYDSQAIVGVAHGHAGRRPLSSADFAGGPETIALMLEHLGFVVEREPTDEANGEVLAAARGLTAAEALALLWSLSRFRQGEVPDLDVAGLADLLSRYAVVGSAETVFADLRADWLWARAESTAGLSEQAQLLLADDRCAEALSGHLSDMYLMDTDVADLLRSVRQPAMTSGRAWSLLTLSGNRDFQGNDGYEDVTGATYTYDSTVQHHKDLAVGHVVLLRDREWALGAARVERIDTVPERIKIRKRCPSCASTDFKHRKRLQPTYRCTSCGHEFEVPANEDVSVTVYTAHYERSWRPFDRIMSKADLEQLATNRSTQQSIRPLDLVRVTERLNGLQLVLPEARAPHGGARDDVRGGSRKALVRVRTGQQGFRRMLLDSYGPCCAVTGPCPEAALQAAHLRGFAKHQRHRREEGLLLRADIHSLFDRGLLAVDPDQLVIVVAPELAEFKSYTALAGRPLSVDRAMVPDRSALREHFDLARAGWAG